MADSDVIALGTTPIPGDNPAGEDAQYEPEFEELQAEIDKLQSMTGEEVDWNRVVTLGREILETKSKDVKAGSYLAVGLFMTKNYDGLSDGLEMLKGMIETHWEDLFPPLKRVRARKTAVEWLKERVLKEFEGVLEVGADKKEPLERLHAAAKDLMAACNEKFGDFAPGLHSLDKAIKDKLAMIPKEGEGEGEGGGAEAAPVAAGGAPAAKGMAGVSGPIGSRADAFKRLKEVADFLRKTEPHSPVSYLVQRAIKWGEMPFEMVIEEMIKDKNARNQIRETLGLGE